MIRFILPIILIGIAVTGFLMFTNPLYDDISILREQLASYDEALKNSKDLENERDKLTAKYNSINPDDLAKLQKLLPDHIDNIRLILEIEKIASPYNMVLRDVKYDAGEKSASATGSPNVVQGSVMGKNTLENYGIWELQFSITNTYSNFLNFARDLENNLRIVDVSSISFSSEGDAKSNPSGMYKHDFRIKTYWLKN